MLEQQAKTHSYRLHYLNRLLEETKKLAELKERLLDFHFQDCLKCQDYFRCSVELDLVEDVNRLRWKITDIFKSKDFLKRLEFSN